MTSNEILAIKKNRFKRLSNNPKNIKAGGVIKKLSREIRNLEKNN